MGGVIIHRHLHLHLNLHLRKIIMKNGKLKNFLVDVSQIRLFLWLTGHIRPLILLRFVKMLSLLPGGKLITGMFDPNIIRKKIHINFKQQLVPLTSYGGHFMVDVNEHLGYHFFIKNGFDSIVQKIAQYLEINEDDILLDIGANIGSTCIPFGIHYGAEIIAVEASKTNASLLLKNAAINKVKIVSHIACAVDPITANNRQWLKFYSKNGNSAANSIFDSWNPSKSEEDYEFVKTTTLDTILADVNLNRIKLIKIDVEGAEAMVIRGFSKLAELDAPLLFEYRVDVMKRDLDQDGSEIVALLKTNFDIFGLNQNDGGLTLTTFYPEKPYDNAIAIPKSKADFFKTKFPHSTPD